MNRDNTLNLIMTTIPTIRFSVGENILKIGDIT